MRKFSTQFTALATILAILLSLGAANADTTTTKKKKKRHYARPAPTYQPTPAQYNQCVRDQLRWPEMDIRC